MVKLSGQYSVVISNRVGACPVEPLPFEEHSNMSDRLKKQVPGKADQSISIHVCIIARVWQ